MIDYGLDVRFYPPGVIGDKPSIVFEVNKWEDGKIHSYVQVLDVEAEMPQAIKDGAPDPTWMTWILATSIAGIITAVNLADEPTDVPAVVKAALASVKRS